MHPCMHVVVRRKAVWSSTVLVPIKFSAFDLIYIYISHGGTESATIHRTNQLMLQQKKKKIGKPLILAALSDAETETAH